MAQFYFYGTWKDSEEYLDVLSQSGTYTFVVDMWYSEPVPFQFTQLTGESRAIMRKRRSVWLWSEKYSRFPPQFGEPTSNGLMRIEPVNSGPALDHTLPAHFERDGKVCLAPGDLFYQPQYRDPVTGIWYKPPEDLKRAFAEVKTLICKRMHKLFASARIIREGEFKTRIETIWLGSDAEKSLNLEQAEILINGEWQTGQMLSEKRDEVKEQDNG